MTRKKVKKKQLEEEREFRKETTPNGMRKSKYSSMACSGELGTRELKYYMEIRAYVLNHTRKEERPDLPYECPKQSHYDLARLLYGNLIGTLNEEIPNLSTSDFS
jgi:hypothetical protein